ncbi:MAG: ankyrin repeat domain-containing protein [Gammaproteobacteria bacterium]
MKVRPHGIGHWLACPAITLGLLLSVGVCAGSPALDRQLLARAAEATPAELGRLIKAGANVNAQDRYGVTPLMQAVIGNNTAAVSTLISAGSDLRVKDFRGDTALDLARALGRTEIINLLGHMNSKGANSKMPSSQSALN